MKNKKVNQQEIKDETKTYMLEGMSMNIIRSDHRSAY